MRVEWFYSIRGGQFNIQEDTTIGESRQGYLKAHHLLPFLPPQKSLSQIRPVQPRIANPETPFSGSTGNDAHAHGKNGGLPLFSRTAQKEGHLNLQYSGLYFAPVFRRCWRRGEGQKTALLRRSHPEKKILIFAFFRSIRVPGG